jgi:hypothetical protein
MKYFMSWPDTITFHDDPPFAPLQVQTEAVVISPSVLVLCDLLLFVDSSVL